MPNQELFDYIKKSKEAGQTNEQIKSVLISNGWQIADIENAFNLAEGSKVKNYSNRAILIALAIILILLAGGSFAFWKFVLQKPINIQKNTVQTKISSPTISESATAWETYNGDFFSFRYPKDFTLTDVTGKMNGEYTLYVVLYASKVIDTNGDSKVPYQINFRVSDPEKYLGTREISDTAKNDFIEAVRAGDLKRALSNGQIVATTTPEFEKNLQEFSSLNGKDVEISLDGFRQENIFYVRGSGNLFFISQGNIIDVRFSDFMDDTLKPISVDAEKDLFSLIKDRPYSEIINTIQIK